MLDGDESYEVTEASKGNMECQKEAINLMKYDGQQSCTF